LGHTIPPLGRTSALRQNPTFALLKAARLYAVRPVSFWYSSKSVA
jgi:hypothetical protein